MDRIEEICDKIGQCDDNIIEQLVARMRCIQDIIEYKKEKGIPILQPEQEKKQEDNLKRKLGDNPFEEEILDIFKGFRLKLCLIIIFSLLALWAQGKALWLEN